VSDSGKRDKGGALSALALPMQLGLTIAAPIVAGVWGGNWLDARLGGGGLILVASILLGIAAGLFGAYCLLMKEIRWKR